MDQPSSLTALADLGVERGPVAGAARGEHVGDLARPVASSTARITSRTEVGLRGA